MGEAVAGSFRDRCGTVYRRDGVLYREILPGYREHWSQLAGSGLLELLQRSGDLIPHEEAPLGAALTGEAWKVIRPEPIPFLSWPWEWCFGELKAAALLTLRVQRTAVERGASLRDASAFNVQFRMAKPILIDTLSFEPYQEGSPWVAYRQFCQHFLAPLLLMSRVDPRLGLLTREHIDGVPLDLAAALLPWATRWRPSIALHIHWHAAAIRRHRNDGAAAAKTAGRMSRTALLGLIDNLESLISRLDCRLKGSEWWDYEETHGYESESRRAKEAAVLELAGAEPGVVWDLGANTGRFAELLAPRARHVVAMDLDHGAVERHWRRRMDHPARILPLVMDLTNPTPGTGWTAEERESLAARGPADTLLALALVHHLAIGNNLPLTRIAAWLAGLGRRAVVEWVPKTDPQTRRLLVAREDIFGDYTRPAFEAAMRRHFTVRGERPIAGTERVLYLLERNPA